MTKRNNTPKKINICCLIIGILAFFAVLSGSYLFNMNKVKEEKMRAAFTAETTVNRVKSQISRYLGVSEFFQNIIESGKELDDEEFTFLSEMISDDSGIIKAIELAPDGIVKDIYPVKGNEAAFGIDMLNNPARKYEANLAMNSGEYTIAGPYELNQGGLGSLLFEPVYVNDPDGKESFWGFSILVLDWNKFIEELELDKLEDASYCYQIWKKDGSSGKKVTIAGSGDDLDKDAVQVKCQVPNDTWYFDIIPRTGWITARENILAVLLSLGVSLAVVFTCYQVFHRKYRERMYTKEIERAAEKARKANEAKTRFLFNMSHDIRTPMNAIVGFSGLLEKNLDDQEKSRGYIRKIQTSSNILLTIINQVLEMARIESGKTTLNLEAVSIHEMLESMNTVFEASLGKKALEYENHVDIRHDHILCDKTKVEEIILNVVSNSIKYTDPHGKISVTIDELDQADKGRASYRVVVSDTGIGMSEDYLPHIFEEFSREHTTTETRVAGTGLGLPIVKSLVDLMGGTIQVKSRPGEGTEFCMELSFQIATEEHVRDKQEQKISDIAKRLKGRKILLAEDNELNAEIAVTILTDMGIEVVHAQDGIQCLEELQKKPALYFDAVLMDVQMPNMDGYTATKKIRSQAGQISQIPIIAMTANAYDEDRQKALEAGMNGFLAKPLNVDEMVRLLGKIIKI